MDFAADSIQGVLFLSPSQHQDDALKLWDILFPNDPPDGFQRATPTSPALNSSAHGDRQGFQTTVNAQVGRIDLILAQSPQVQPSDSGPPRIAEVHGAAIKAAEFLKRLARQLKAFRAAMVIDLSKTVQTGNEAAEIIGYLPGFPFPANVSDLGLQFNSRKSFQFSTDFEMNRMCTWSSGQVGFVKGPNMQPSSMVVLTPYVGLKIDVNSAPQLPLPFDKIPTAIDELTTEALAIESEGVTRLIS